MTQQAISLLTGKPLIRNATPADIPGINKLFTDEYGEGYPYQINGLNKDHIDIVAELFGEIVGYARAVPYGHYTHVWELGGLVVRPDCRRMGIARSFTIERICQLKAMGVKTLVSESVACYENCASQHNLVAFGFKPHGILPFQHPWIRPEYHGEQPLSLVLMVGSLNGGTGFGRRKLSMTSPDYKAALRFLNRTDLRPPWAWTREAKMPDVLSSKPKQTNGITGSSFVDVPINWMASRSVAHELREDGYRFSAILPGFGRTQTGEHYDLLRLYKPPKACRHNHAFAKVHVLPKLEPLKQFCMSELTY